MRNFHLARENTSSEKREQKPDPWERKIKTESINSRISKISLLKSRSIESKAGE